MSVIFLAGNLSEGFSARGPYVDHDTCAFAHDCEEGWMMTLNPPRPDGDVVYEPVEPVEA